MLLTHKRRYMSLTFLWIIVFVADARKVHSFQLLSFFRNRSHDETFSTRSFPPPPAKRIPVDKKEEESSSSNFSNNDEKLPTLVAAERTILKFLEEDGRRRGKFLLPGWRWHNMSLIREAGRLREFAAHLQQLQLQRTSTSSSSVLSEENVRIALKTAIDYVVGFNMKGMNRVEKEVMVPCLRKQFRLVNDDTVVQALDTLLNHIENEQKKLTDLGSSLEDIGASLSSSSNLLGKDDRDSINSNCSLLEEVIKKSNAIIELATLMLEYKNSALIPATTTIVPEREQKAIISKITSALGVFDSRLHLVGFHEAIINNEREQQLWQDSMPVVVRKLIPMWKRTQYDPRVCMLNL